MTAAAAIVLPPPGVLPAPLVAPLRVPVGEPITAPVTEKAGPSGMAPPLPRARLGGRQEEKP